MGNFDFLPEVSKTYPRDSRSNSGELYYDIVHHRYDSALEALQKRGISNAMMLAYFLSQQSIFETGWIDKIKGNNYGGHVDYSNKKLVYKDAVEGGDKHLDKLDKLWPRGRDSKSLDEYLNIINDKDWAMRSNEDIIAEQNRRIKLGLENLYLYAPGYNNHGKLYNDEVKSITNRFVSYLKM